MGARMSNNNNSHKDLLAVNDDQINKPNLIIGKLQNIDNLTPMISPQDHRRRNSSLQLRTGFYWLVAEDSAPGKGHSFGFQHLSILTQYCWELIFLYDAYIYDRVFWDGYNVACILRSSSDSTAPANSSYHSKRDMPSKSTLLIVGSVLSSELFLAGLCYCISKASLSWYLCLWSWIYFTSSDS